MNASVAFVKRVLARVSNRVVVGASASGCAAMRQFSDSVMALGAAGVMVEVCRAHTAGRVEAAHDVFDAYLPLARYEQQSGIGLAVRKHLLQQRGVIASAAVRKPGPSLSAADLAHIERLVKRQTRRLAQLG